jgi:hypothetical protein
MKVSARYLIVAILAAAGAAAAAAAVRADTWTLTLKRRESQNPRVFDRESYIYWTSQPQSFFGQSTQQGRLRVSSVGNPDQAKAFARIVKKEPKYVSDRPFRGVAKLGSQEYAFALDAVPAKAESKEQNAKEENPEEEEKVEVKKASGDSPGGKPKAPPHKKAPPAKVTPYNRLYFDFNRNGDLTDDKVINAAGSDAPRALQSAGALYWQFHFPRIDLMIDVAGTKAPYSFLLTGYGYAGPQISYTNVMLNAAVRREGRITLAGKKHHVVLLDFNSNGRFDDEMKISTHIRLASGGLYADQGDMLLIDPEKAQMESPYDVTAGTTRHYVSKMVRIDDRFYDVKISPAGDKLTLIPSRVAMGRVTNPNDSFRAVLYGERGFLAIQGAKDTPVPVPEGRWKLFSYTIEQKERPAAAKPAREEPATNKETPDAASWQKQAEAVMKLLGGRNVDIRRDLGIERGSAVVSAQATDRYQAVEVRKGKTVMLPFGPPYKPKVSSFLTGRGQAFLQMSLIGSAGEVCTNLMVGGRRPAKPAFTITDPKGKVVEEGDFEYG